MFTWLRFNKYTVVDKLLFFKQIKHFTTLVSNLLKIIIIYIK